MRGPDILGGVSRYLGLARGYGIGGKPLFPSSTPSAPPQQELNIPAPLASLGQPAPTATPQPITQGNTSPLGNPVTGNAPPPAPFAAAQYQYPSGLTGDASGQGGTAAQYQQYQQPQQNTGGGDLFSQFYNSPQSQAYLQSQSDVLTRLGALQTQLAQTQVPGAAEYSLNAPINQLTNQINNLNPQQLLKDNPAYQNAGITQAQLERTAYQQGVPLTQSLSNLVLSKSVLAQQRQVQGLQLGAEAAGLGAQAQIGQQLRQITMFGGLPPEIANTILQRQLFPPYSVATDAFGQPVAITQTPGGGFKSTPIGPSVFGGTPGGYGGTVGTTPAARNNNPGNLKDPRTGQFMQFQSPQQGFQALQSDILAKMTGGNATSTGLGPTSTLLDFAKVYAPSSDNNNPVQYAQNLAQQLGVPVNTPIGQLRDRVPQFAQAVAVNEDQAYASQLFGGGQQSSGDPLTDLANEVLQGRTSPDFAKSQLSTVGQKIALDQRLQQLSGGTYNQQYAQANYEATQQALKNAVPLIQAQKTAIDHLNALQDTVNAVNFGNSPLLNNLATLSSNYLWKDQNIANMQAQINVVRGEVAKVLGGGSSTVESLQEAQAVVPDNLSPANFAGVKAKVLDLMESKIREYTNTGNIAQFRNNPQPSSNIQIIPPEQIPAGYYQASDGLLYKK